MSKATREYKRKVLMMRAMSSLKKQIHSLEQSKESYAQKAKEYKLKGAVSLYNVSRSGLKATLIQLKKLELMLLNMEIIIQQKDFVKLSASFLRGVQIANKELQKSASKMNFSKTAKIFYKAFLSAGIVDDSLQILLSNTENTFETMIDNNFEKEIDAIIGAEVAYEEELFDKKLEQRLNTSSTQEGMPMASICEKEKSFDYSSNYNVGKDKPITLSNQALRPIDWDDFQGQSSLIKKVQESINAAKIRKEPLKHILLYGPPGLGKTTLAKIIAKEMGTHIYEINGLNLKNITDVSNQLKMLQWGDILFIDEIHCISPKAQEALYMALEDFEFTFYDSNKPITRSIPRFTLIGATTYAGRLNKPFLDRISNQFVLQRYPHNAMQKIILNMFNKLEFTIDEQVAMMLAERCRGVPRIARGHCERLTDKALNKNSKVITKEIMQEYFDDINLDCLGLTGNDIKLLQSLITLYSGGPIGLTTLANSIGVNEEEIKEKIEPYLHYLGLLNTLPSGRVATEKAYKHLARTQGKEGVKPQVGITKKIEDFDKGQSKSQKDKEATFIYHLQKDTNAKREYINFAEQEVAEILGGLSDEYTVYNNILLRNNENKIIEIDHIVVSKYGIFVIETKNHSGHIKGYQHSEFFIQTKRGRTKSIYNPILQNAGHVKVLLHILGDFPIYSVIVFSNSAELDIDSTTYVCNVNQLRGYLEDKREQVISAKGICSINTILKKEIITDEKIKREHIESIKAKKITKRAQIQQSKCPNCQIKMIGIEEENTLFLVCPQCGYKNRS